MRTPPTGPAAVLALALFSGCAETTPVAEPFELRDVVDARIRELEASLPPPADTGELDPELEEEVVGTIQMLAHSRAALGDLPLDSIREMGPATTPVLASTLRNPEVPAAERAAAAELLSALDHPAAAEVLMREAEESREPWVRTYCAWYLGRTTQDHLVPRLVKRLNYEKEHDTFVWLATTLAHFRNYSGMEALHDIGQRSGNETLRASALAQYRTIAADVGLEDPDEIRRLWGSIEAESLPQPTPSPRLELEVWRLLSDLGEEHFQLRGVDDARFVLSNMGPWVAHRVAEALADEDLYVRLHGAQVLERMGPRASVAGSALARSLAEPALAPAAAEALGRVGYPPAEPALLERTERERPHELRVACVRALGRLGLPSSLDRVRELFDDASEPDDLRMEAATALVLLGDGARAAAWLVDELAGDRDPAGAEVALHTWLVAGAQANQLGFAAALEAWNAHAGPPGVILSTERRAEIRRRRAEALAPHLDGL